MAGLPSLATSVVDDSARQCHRKRDHSPLTMSNQRKVKSSAGHGRAPVRRSQQGRPGERRPPKRRAGRSPKPLIAAAAALLAVAIAAVVIVSSTGSPGAQLGGPAGPEGVTLETGTPLAAAGAVPPSKGAGSGVGCGATEQLATHTHTHLAVFVDGALRPIPPGVGMVGTLQSQSTPHGTFVTGSSTCLYWLHTHAQDGIIHVEAPAGRSFFLGQFFAVWGQPLSQNQVGPAKGPVTAYVNGKLWTRALANIPLASHELIQLDVGTPIVPPRKVSFPSTL